MKRTDPYTGPFPRKRHSHRCKGCEKRGQLNAVACYKSRCSKPQLTDQCSWCRPCAPSVTYRPVEKVDVRVGDRFIHEVSLPYTDGSESKTHTVKLLIEVTKVENYLADWKTVEGLEEHNRPSWQTSDFAGMDCGGFSIIKGIFSEKRFVRK